MAEPEKHTFDGHVDDGTEVEAEHFVEVEEGKGHEEGGSNSEEMIAGNPKLAEDRMTSLQLENVSPQAEGSKIEPELHPTTLLPAPLHLDTHPADALHPPDSPTTSLITSLRSQLHLLTEQAQQLNNKLVTSISRGADLEDQLYTLQTAHTARGKEVETLEKAKAQWEESMNTGLLVERSQIKDEMQRLAAGLVEEERRRGSAEEKRFQVENEVDNLTASLFDQANTMVAAERVGRIQAEERLQKAEENLANAEAAVRDLQIHFQSLPTSTIVAGQPSSPTLSSSLTTTINRRYLASHIPYTEFLIFLQHLRALRPLKESSKAMFPPPIITNLMAQPFIARSAAEDHEPTLRLDLAPDLSWLSRRSVGQAIIAGELIIEPVPASTVIANSNSAIADIGCSLCGKPVFPSTLPHSPNVGNGGGSHFGVPPTHPTNNRKESRFSLKPFFNTGASPSQSGNSTPTQSPITSPAPGHSYSSLPSVYIFRIAKPPATGINTAASQAAEKEAKSYPLCKSGWCLERLRATCELWHFVRTGIIHVVWHGDDGYVLSSEGTSSSTISQHDSTPRERTSSIESPSLTVVHGTPPMLPPRKKSGWGLGFALKERSTSTGGGGWGKALYRGTAGAASPPVSPSLSNEGTQLGQQQEQIDRILGEEKPRSIHDGVSPMTNIGDAVLGAPLELDAPQEGNDPVADKSESVETVENVTASVGQEEKADDGIQAIQEPESHPVDDKKDEEKKEEEGEAAKAEGEDETALKTPSFKRNDSTLSVNGSEVDDADFSTPKGVHAELSPDLPAETEDKLSAGPDKSAEDAETRDLSIQTTDSSTGEISLNSPIVDRSNVPAAVPPPIPRRAAARNRMSQLGSSGTSTPIEGRSSEVITAESVENGVNPNSSSSSEGAGGQDVEVENQAEVEAEGQRESEKATTEEDKRLSTTSSTFKVAAPPLPPRHPRTPTQQVQTQSGESHNADGEKSYLGDEGWEIKTWKQVLKIKEEMWKARVGVCD